MGWIVFIGFLGFIAYLTATEGEVLVANKHFTVHFGGKVK